jgi:hypothetical protein
MLIKYIFFVAHTCCGSGICSMHYAHSINERNHRSNKNLHLQSYKHDDGQLGPNVVVNT